MFKKLILIIVIIAVGCGVFLFANRSASNDKQALYGGIFESDHYRNNSAGINVDLSDGWVYFDRINLSELSSFGVPASASWLDTSDEKILFYALKPGVLAMASFEELNFSQEYMNESYMKYLADYACEVLAERDGGAEVLEYGKLYGADNVYYFNIRLIQNPHKKEANELICAYMNTPKGALTVVGASQKTGGSETIKDFIRDDVSISGVISEISL